MKKKISILKDSESNDIFENEINLKIDHPIVHAHEIASDYETYFIIDRNYEKIKDDLKKLNMKEVLIDG